MADEQTIGVAPLDPTSPVGKFRTLYGDTNWTPLDPPTPGLGVYEELSDEEIETFISAAGGSVLRGIGIYVQSLATHAAAQSRIIKDHDLQVSTLQKSTDYRRAAEQWFKLADAEDHSEGANDIFAVHSTRAGGAFIPEGTIPQYGRRYTWDVWS